MKFNPPIQREFVEPSESDAFISWLFKGRCVICHQPASEINHIVLRSRDASRIHDWKNKVTLCQLHHSQYHEGGVTDEKVEKMELARKKFLVMIGRGEYLRFDD